MVGIKDFNMPSDCSMCGLLVDNMDEYVTCALLGSDYELTDYNCEHRDDKCPLVEIDSEVKA